jgi:hypothetical protein
MKVFDHFNAKEPCPVCKTQDDKPTVLVLIDGTEKDHIYEAIQVHAECAIVTNYNRALNALYIKL